MSNVAAAKSANGNGEKTFFGHPKGLQTLFFTEMWERFSYYGMRAFLVVYISTAPALGGLGQSEKAAGIFYALYGSSIYLMSLPGGWIADRFIGQRMAVLLGGIVIMCGHISLAIPSYSTFLLGLGLLVVGTGFLKPNVSTIVGQLYDKNDPRRDAGYSIYYMGINIGAFFAPIVCGFLAQSNIFKHWLAGGTVTAYIPLTSLDLVNLTGPGWNPNHAWHFGFGAAAVGMLFGVIQFVYGWKWLGTAGTAPDRANLAKGPSLPTPAWIIAAVGAAVIALSTFGFFYSLGATKDAVKNSFGVGLLVISVCLFTILYQYVARDADERRRVRAMMVLFLGCLSFFALFEQAGSTLSLFAEKQVHRELFGIDFPSSYYQFLNAAYVVLLAPVFVGIWAFLKRRNQEPTSVTKFAIGMVLTALAFATLLPPLLGPIADGQKTSGLWLFLFYFVVTWAELCISPVGLSTMNKLAPDRLAGFVMGIWFLATAVGYFLAGIAEHEVGSLAKHLDLHPTAGLFYLLILFVLMIALILYLLAGPVKRMLAQEPELPRAKVH
jgi:POT family proton-dependent oligopeptide transporter